MNKLLTEGEQRDLWRSGKGWPEIDPPGHVFLGRAIRALGTKMFDDAWTGTEPVAFVPSPLTRPKSFPSQPPRSIATATAQLPVVSTLFDEAAFGQAQVARERQIIEATAALSRWNSVRLTITRWLVGGHLRFALRFPDGKMIDGDSSNWNTDRAATNFRCCQLVWTSGTGAWDSSWPLPVFVLSADLDTLLQGQMPGAKPDWWPTDRDNAKSWVTGPAGVAILAEARRRSRLFALAPGRNDDCRALVVMWADATGKELSWQTFQQYLLAERT